jgi:hypothetical protein
MIKLRKDFDSLLICIPTKGLSIVLAIREAISRSIAVVLLNAWERRNVK